ncbi:hypothetical protein ABW21_db0201730 [Orbilia brochopaga]|nr:hypothetical protein ABW21_db0201730 [Drechslerella brochopaga]
MAVIKAQDADTGDSIQKLPAQSSPVPEHSHIEPAASPAPEETGLRITQRRGYSITKTTDSSYEDDDAFIDEHFRSRYRSSYELFGRSDSPTGLKSTYADAMEIDLNATDSPVQTLMPMDTNSGAGAYRDSSDEDSDPEDEEGDKDTPGKTRFGKSDTSNSILDSDGDITMTDAQRIALGLFAASSTPATDLRVATTRSAAREHAAALASARKPRPSTPLRKTVKSTPARKTAKPNQSQNIVKPTPSQKTTKNEYTTPVTKITSETSLYRNAKNTGNTTEHRSLGWYDSTSFSPLESSGEQAEIAAAKAAAAAAKGPSRKKKQVVEEEEESEEESSERILPSSSDDERPRRAAKGKARKQDSDGSDFNDSEGSAEESAPKKPGRKPGRKPKNAEDDASPKVKKAAKKKQPEDAVFKPDASSSEVDDDVEEKKVKQDEQQSDKQHSDEPEEENTDDEDAAEEDEGEGQEDTGGGTPDPSSGSSDAGATDNSESGSGEDNEQDSVASEDDEENEDKSPSPESVAVRASAAKLTRQHGEQAEVSHSPPQSDPRGSSQRINTNQDELGHNTSPSDPAGLRRVQAEKAFELQEEYKRDGSLREVKMTGFMPSLTNWFSGRKDTPPPAPAALRPPTPAPAPSTPTNEEEFEVDEETLKRLENGELLTDYEASEHDPHDGDYQESNGRSDGEDENEESGQNFEITAQEVREIEEEMGDAVNKLMHQMEQTERLQRLLNEKTIQVEQLECKLAEETQKAAEAQLELEAKKNLGYDRLSLLYQPTPQLGMNDIPCFRDEDGSKFAPLVVQIFERPPFSTKLVNNPFRHEDMDHRREIVNNLSFPGNIMLADFETEYQFRCCSCHAMSEVRLLFFQDELVWSTCICFTCYEHFCCANCTRYTGPKDPSRLPTTTDAVDRLKKGEASGNYETLLYVRGIWADYLQKKAKKSMLDVVEERYITAREENDEGYDNAAEKAKELGLRAAGKGKRKRVAAQEEEEETVNPKSKKPMIAAMREKLERARKLERRPPVV